MWYDILQLVSSERRSLRLYTKVHRFYTQNYKFLVATISSVAHGSSKASRGGMHTRGSDPGGHARPLRLRLGVMMAGGLLTWRPTSKTEDPTKTVLPSKEARSFKMEWHWQWPFTRAVRLSRRREAFLNWTPGTSPKGPVFEHS